MQCPFEVGKFGTLTSIDFRNLCVRHSLDRTDRCQRQIRDVRRCFERHFNYNAYRYLIEYGALDMISYVCFVGNRGKSYRMTLVLVEMYMCNLLLQFSDLACSHLYYSRFSANHVGAYARDE